MAILDILNFSRGYVSVKATGEHLERFINMCTCENINIWNVKSRGLSTLTACVSVKGFFLLKNICRKTGTKIHIISKKGLPFLSLRLRKRIGLLIGFAVFVLASFWLFSHIWYIDVDTSTSIPSEELLSQLELAGVEKGTPLRQIDPNKVQARLLNLNPRLVWAWPHVRGNSLYLEVREKVSVPEILPTNPCNIVASHSGLITSMLVKEGRHVVTEDMYVSEGQLLVGGIMDSVAMGVRYVHADAEIWATTEESLSETFSLITSETNRTGNNSVRYTLKFGNLPISTPLIGKSFAAYETEDTESTFHIGSVYFPISLIKTEYMETLTETVVCPQEQIEQEAQQYLETLLQNSLKNGMILEKRFDIQKLDDKTISVTLNAVCSRQIALAEPIEEEINIGRETD
ncbi:MAG: sporulation protein YqfD [Clostridia bacterium]|nr:sporulation protein YqfD [Clostridia bacterium]